MKTFGWITTWITSAIICITLKGYTISTLWGWFIVTTFDATAINTPQAIGLSLITSYLTKTFTSPKTDKSLKEQFVRDTVINLSISIFSLIIGYITLQFI